ncbi:MULTISPECIES: PTS transporter subunit IIBC [Priestia]|jgi:PTS system glucose-specific IIC component|uniref:Phosphotransferase system, IIBC component n=3 Tax=Priestia TaxID=2800373 RepID=D5DWN0_PRIM1|nr:MULTISPECIES: PTS transporter subunit IIBC [Priestia]AVX11053.1 PTS transporter subunit IICB [Bacillus sp. Y-01]KOP77114.1 PTS transporter subunit IICB [Bacillus sp. FJAT-21351]KQU18085.1 PTS transporter subunit IICB [Bacillus sp. Leaf75]MBZ5481753.1 PTS transporter subunit EIIC [Bacillus sp. T_4]MDH6651786.1 PTS system glucose-specific IIC component [Bacillus sp. PvP124]MDP9578929.1 PTS system glucose-specific IIC component [Bacillus sp. 1751]RFB22738.1 PTS transporter subunit IICB [Baci
MKKFFSFDFWQKFGKALLVVVAVMPAAGIMISLGKLVAMTGGDITAVQTIARVMEDIGWGIITNLHILFAVAIGGSWAKERAGGAFAALIAFILINRITGAIFGVKAEMLSDSKATVQSLFGQELVVKDYFTSILGSPALNMGVFVGIIAGFLGANLFNKYYNYDKLPEALSFFNGKRFVPFVVIGGSVVTALLLSIVWPFIQGSLNSFGQWIATSRDTAPILAPFIFGALERLLLPFGLHHMLTVPMNYTELGGTYKILTGSGAGSTVAGQDPLWLAWIADLNNFRAAGDMDSYKQLLHDVTPARFKVGQMILSCASLIGIALAMYRNVDPDKRSKYRSMFFSAGLAVFLTGVTEPIEFMFMFAAPLLYVVYAIMTGLAFAIVDIVHVRVHSFGVIELLTRTPMIIKAGLWTDLMNFVIACLVFFGLNFGVANFLIKRFNFPTPGRNGNYIDEETTATSSKQVKNDSLAPVIIGLLGGENNIEDVDACMTRLRVTVKDIHAVAGESEWKQNGALGLILKDKGVQAIYGPKADVLKSDIQDLLGA